MFLLKVHDWAWAVMSIRKLRYSQSVTEKSRMNTCDIQDH